MDAAITEAKLTKGKPTVIILNTTKGCGVSFMENQAVWHHKTLSEEQYQLALEELRQRKESLV